MGSTRICRGIGVGTLLWVVVAWLLREHLEVGMLRHALIQLPCLVLAGVIAVPRPVERRAEPLALPALLVALFGAAIWMLPRQLDASLDDPFVEAAKLVTLPLLVGLPLGWSWPRLHGVTRAFVWSNLVSMLLVLGWLYRAAPLRVCSYYLLREQEALGAAYLCLAGVIALAWLPRLFLASDRGTTPGRSPGGAGRGREKPQLLEAG
jgi:hypothetical protein